MPANEMLLIYIYILISYTKHIEIYLGGISCLGINIITLLAISHMSMVIYAEN